MTVQVPDREFVCLATIAPHLAMIAPASDHDCSMSGSVSDSQLGIQQFPP